MKKLSEKFFSALGVVALSAGALWAQACEHDPISPEMACPVGTDYDPETGSCEAIIT